MNLIPFLFLIGYNFCYVISKNYLLTPKESLYSLNTNMNFFANEHNLQEVLSIDELKVYESSPDNFKKFESTFLELFHVEENGYVHVPNPSENYFDVYTNSIVFDQYPGQLSFNIRGRTHRKNEIPWHLSRIAQRNLPLNDNFPYNKTGSCHVNDNVKVNTYVIDTGIDIEHSEFEGRATWLANFADKDDSDCQSHGTHCAGLIGSRHFGACKDANLFAIKVLDCRGYGSFTSILQGLQEVYKHHSEQLQNLRKGDKLRSVVSMSLGGGYSFVINKAVEKLLSYGDIYIIVAAGNEDNDACEVSPASANGVITIMASDKNDNRAYFSNYGKCADVYSPGVDIISTIPGNKHAKYSGTSMATPIYAGVVNHYLNRFPDLTVDELKEKIAKDATKDHILDNQDETNNLLVFLGL